MQSAPVAQVSPQVPQLARSFVRLAQYAEAPLPQVVNPVAHVSVHMPPVQVWPAAHTVPQVPQFVGSVLVLVQTPEHAVSLVRQLVEHMPLPLQTWPAAQAVPHVPQLFRSLERFAQ